MNLVFRPFTAALSLAVLTTGCATAPPKQLVNPPTASVDGKLVTGTLKAMCDKPSDCKTLQLTLNNKTDQTIEIDWNRSYYLNNGKPDGGLYYDGIVVAHRNNLRPPDVILAKSEFKKTLVPNINLSMVVFPVAHWDMKVFTGAKHGVYLTLKAGTQEEVINVSVDVNSK